MERSLAKAGSPAKAADTPAEVLARATAGGLVSSSCASTLTGLFRRARYSSHPMTEDDRAAAMEALAEVRADLGESRRGAGMSWKRPAVRTVAQVAAVIIVALLTLGTSLAITGPFGLVVAADCLAASWPDHRPDRRAARRP